MWCKLGLATARSILIVGLAGYALAGASAGPKRPLNEIPMYGGVTSPAQVRADENFLEAVRKTGRSFSEASEHALQRGWQAFGRRDLGSAMKRFNQAWLLNKQNGGVYWAFAIAVMVRDEDFAASEKLFHRALELIPDNPVLIQDLAKTLGMKGEKLRREGEETSAVESFTKSNEYYQKALKVDQIADKAHAGMATNYLNLKNFGLAAHHAGLAIERGQGNEFEIVHIVKCLRRKGLELSDDPGVLPAFKACERWVQSRSRQ